jgi:hypothetical protein
MSSIGRGIRIDGSPLDAFTGKVAAPQADTAKKYDSYLQRVFVHLKYRQVGRLVIEAIDDAGHLVTIYPHPNQVDAVTNAEIEPVTGRRLPRALSRTYSAATKTCSPRLAGAATTILFPPEASLGGDSQVGWRVSGRAWQLVRPSPSVPAIDPGNRYFDVDDTLLHELVHAMRFVRGLICRRPLGDGWQDSEEFLAVTITNMYLSEKGKESALRGDYGRTFKPLTDPGGFAFRYKELLQQFRDEMPDLAGKLASVNCRFNPMRDYVRAFASVSF